MERVTRAGTQATVSILREIHGAIEEGRVDVREIYQGIADVYAKCSRRQGVAQDFPPSIAELAPVPQAPAERSVDSQRNSTPRTVKLEARTLVTLNGGFLPGAAVTFKVKLKCNRNIDDETDDDEIQMFENIEGKVVSVQYGQTSYLWQDFIPVVDQFNHLKLVSKGDLKSKRPKRKRKEKRVCVYCQTARPVMSCVHGNIAHLIACEACVESDDFCNNRTDMKCPICNEHVERIIQQY